MASNTEQPTNEESTQKINSVSSSDLDKTQTNISMTDENRDPSTTKFRPKPVDARSAAAASLISCSSLDSPKSATITNVSQRLPSTSVEVSVGDILSTEEKRASVSIREQQSQQQSQQQQHHHRHSSSSCSSSDYDDTNENTFSTTNKMDLGEATRELTRLLHIGNENTNNEIHLNPDAPDFTPIDFSPTYRSELAPAHLNRRVTQTDYYNNRHSRSRYYSESYHHSIPPNTSTIRPLLSLVPQYVPYHRQSWTTTSGQNSSSNNSWWQQEYSNPSSSTSSYHSKAAYPLYSPLMPPLTDDSLYTNRHSSKRQRVQSNRAFVFPSQNPLNRKRSHSGPETPLQTPPTHLNGIHSLAKIMIDILRMIDPLPVQEETKPKTSSTSSYSSQQRKYRRSSNNYSQHRSYQSQQQQNSSVEVEDVFVDDDIPTISATVMNNEHTNTTTIVSNLIDNNKDKEVLISTDTINDESFYEVPTHDESSIPTPST